MEFMVFTGEIVDEFREDFDRAMKSLEEKYGAKISLGAITYDMDHFTARLSVYNGQDEEEAAMSRFDANVWKFEDVGLKKGMYKRIFIGRDGQKYALLGLNVRATKNQLTILHLESGRHYCAGRGFIRELTDTTYVEVK